MNTAKYWKKNNDLRVAESLVDLVEESHRSPKHKIFKRYKNPVSSAIEYNNILSSVKRSTNEIKENLKDT